MSGEGHSNNRTARAKLGLVTHDNTGGYYVVECQGCGSVYPSFQCHGGEAIADTGDYSDATCPHCHAADPEECSNVGLAWNTQQTKINELQQRLTTADQRIDELTPNVSEHPEGHRERFQKWVMATKHPLFGFLDGRSLARSDDREGYADEYVQGLWVAYKEFAAPPSLVSVVPSGGYLRVEVRQCDNCNHVGINDSAVGVGACHSCEWQGVEPTEDKCPGCDSKNCMAAACPKCGARYALLAEENLPGHQRPPPRQGQGTEFLTGVHLYSTPL
ncbi:hypothetical protein [Pseudomonas corrugata]